MIERIKLFFRDVKAEMKKVAFPAWPELKGSTVVVIVTTIIISLFLGAVDIGLSTLVQWVLK